MPKEDYSKLLNTILTLSYQQKLSLYTILEDSIQDEISAPASITVSSTDELHKRIDEGLSDIKEGRVTPAETVHQRLFEKYGI